MLADWIKCNNLKVTQKGYLGRKFLILKPVIAFGEVAIQMQLLQFTWAFSLSPSLNIIWYYFSKLFSFWL